MLQECAAAAAAGGGEGAPYIVELVWISPPHVLVLLIRSQHSLFRDLRC